MGVTSGILGEAWALYRAHASSFLAVGLAVYAATTLCGLVLVVALGEVGALLAVLLTIAAMLWVQAALARPVEAAGAGRPVLPLAALADLRPRRGTIVGAGLVVGLPVAIGTTVAVVPGVLLLALWVAAMPAVVLEGLGATAGLRRSLALVRGRLLPVFLLVAPTYLLLLGAAVLVQWLVDPLPAWLAGSLANLSAGTLVAPFAAVAWNLLFHRLRGDAPVDVDEAAEVGAER